MVKSSPNILTVPVRAVRNPVIVSTNSVCPFPCTPAIPKISPACTVRLTPETTCCWRSSITVRFSIVSRAAPGWARAFSTCRMTFRPTIISASWDSSVASGVTVPTILPWCITEMRSAIAMTSLSLWVIKIAAMP